jgi:N utilization substance protein B
MSGGSEPAAKQPQQPRRAARLAAVQALYEIAVTDADADAILDNFLNQRWPRSGADDSLPPPDLRLLTAIVKGVVASLADLDREIDAILANRRGAERIELLLRAILRVGAFELMAMRTVPTKVILNEYINLAHAFFAGGEPALVNAVLDRLALRFRGAAGALS